MATVQVVIDRAYRLLGQLNLGESADSTESANALIAINAQLDSWRNESLMCYAMQDQSINLANGNTSKTIGPTGDLVTTRPTNIDDAYILYSGDSIPVKIIEYASEYVYIPDKTTTDTYPLKIAYNPEMPDGRIYMYPLPNATSVLHVITKTPVTAFALVSTTISLPPGWEDALAANLALYLAPELQVQPSPMVIGMAANTKRSIKRTNTRPIKQSNELVAISQPYRGNILTGT